MPCLLRSEKISTTGGPNFVTLGREEAMKGEKVIGVIPAAGKGTRLAPFPGDKELFPLGYEDLRVGNDILRRPKVVSQYLIESMAQAGVEKIIIILGEGKHKIMSYYGDGRRFGVDITYLFQEQLTGMPFALNMVRRWFKDRVILFGMPDTVIEPSNVFEQLLDSYFNVGTDLVLGVFPTDTPSKFGMVELDQDDRVILSADKPKETSLRYMWGIACWSETFGDLMETYLREISPPTREIVLGEIFQEAIERGLEVRALRFDEGSYLDIGTPNDLIAALERFYGSPGRATRSL